MKKGSFWKNYWFIICMLIGIIGGCIVGAAWPGATALEPLGTVFINLMFCVVVPMVFCSIASAIANMKSARRAGKVMGVTIGTFLVTAAIAAVFMYIIVLIFPIADKKVVEESVEVAGLGFADMVIPHNKVNPLMMFCQIMFTMRTEFKDNCPQFLILCRNILREFF